MNLFEIIDINEYEINILGIIYYYVDLLNDGYLMNEHDVYVYIHDNDWSKISLCEKLSEKFMEKYKDRIWWSIIFSVQILSEPFIEKIINDYKPFNNVNINKIIWRNITIHQKLSEQFMEKYKDRIWWKYVYSNQKLSSQFIDKYRHKIFNNTIKHGKKKLTMYKSHLKNYHKNTNVNYIYSESKLKYNEDDENSYNVDVYDYNVNTSNHNDIDYMKKVEYLISNKKIPEDFIDKHMYKLHWETICDMCRIQELSDNFIMKHFDNLNLSYLLNNKFVDKQNLIYLLYDLITDKKFMDDLIKKTY